MRGSEIYSAAGRALEDNLFAMRAQLEDSIAQRKGTANLDTFDRQADIDIAGAAERGEINLQELAALQASKEAMFGRETDLFAESELNRIYSRSDYNAALETERAARRRAMERAQEQRIVAQAAAAQQAFQGQQSQLQREHEAALALKQTSGDIATGELATQIGQVEGAASEAQRLSEDYMMVNIDGVDIPVDRDWYIEEHLIGPGAGSNTGSDVNLVEMLDSAGNSFFVDVGGVDEFGNPYLTTSAATNLQITGEPLTPAWAE
jgi:predicted nucleotidyltransferase